MAKYQVTYEILTEARTDSFLGPVAATCKVCK